MLIAAVRQFLSVRNIIKVVVDHLKPGVSGIDDISGAVFDPAADQGAVQAGRCFHFECRGLIAGTGGVSPTLVFDLDLPLISDRSPDGVHMERRCLACIHLAVRRLTADSQHVQGLSM